MATVGEIISFNNPVYTTYLFYCSVLAIKMLVMSVLTSRQRIRKMTFANPEDAKMKGAKVRTDDDVERVRRAHLNDLENIPVFIFVCGVYMMTQPSVLLATMLIRIYAGARILHTIAYAFLKSHSPRGLGWGIGFLITIYMAVMVLVKFSQFM